MNIVLFLGAGFSATYNYPVMNNFFSFVDTNPRLTDEDRDFIEELILESRRANSFLQSSPTNLEDILSFAVMADRLSLSKNENDSRNNKIRKILQKIFTYVSDTKNYWSSYDKFKKFLNFNPNIYNRNNLSIITTNYDINIEAALHRLNLSTYPGFDYKEDQNFNDISLTGNLYSKNGFNVFKLHGSVNWFEVANEPEKFIVEGRIARLINGFDDNKQRSLPLVCTNDYISKSKIPVIIPPSFLKPELKGPLSRIWKSAAEKLNRASILIFVGYSFPQTDTEMMYFLARSLTDNPMLRKIIIIDPYAEEILKKITSPTSKFGSHFRDLLLIENKKWEETSLRKYIN